MEFSVGLEARHEGREAHEGYQGVGAHYLEGPFWGDDVGHMGEERGEMGERPGFDEEGYFGWVVGGWWGRTGGSWRGWWVS